MSCHIDNRLFAQYMNNHMHVTKPHIQIYMTFDMDSLFMRSIFDRRSCIDVNNLPEYHT